MQQNLQQPMASFVAKIFYSRLTHYRVCGGSYSYSRHYNNYNRQNSDRGRSPDAKILLPEDSYVISDTSPRYVRPDMDISDRQRLPYCTDKGPRQIYPAFQVQSHSGLLPVLLSFGQGVWTLKE